MTTYGAITYPSDEVGFVLQSRVAGLSIRLMEAAAAHALRNGVLWTQRPVEQEEYQG